MVSPGGQAGLPEAEYHYGLMLLKGRGVVQDYHAAFNWIEKQAKRGYAKAQYSLGELYRYGTGTAIIKAWMAEPLRLVLFT